MEFPNVETFKYGKITNYFIIANYEIFDNFIFSTQEYDRVRRYDDMVASLCYKEIGCVGASFAKGDKRMYFFETEEDRNKFLLKFG